MEQALKGQLIVTNRRLLYIRYHGGKYLTAKAEDYSDRIEEGLKNEGSFEAPINMTTEATADRVWAHHTSDCAIVHKQVNKPAPSSSYPQ